MIGLSKLHFFSVALVAANKPLNSGVIEATPIENNLFLDGEITDAIIPYSANGIDGNGSSYNENINTTTSVSATWLPLGNSNRMTSPDVRRGELVVLYRFADSDKFWWQTLKNDATLRKLETVVYAFSATQNETDPASADTMYYLEISTHNKLITFHTSKANGEPFSYDIQLDTGKGFFQLQDDAGNYFKLDSEEHQMSMCNQDGSVVEVNKRVINYASFDSINAQTSKYNIKCDDYVLDAKNTITTTTDTQTEKANTTNLDRGALTETATAAKFTADTLESKCIITQTGSITATGDSFMLTGPLTVNGPSSLNGGMTMSAGPGGAPVTATINATMIINGDTAINGGLLNNGVNVGSTHVHGGVTAGPGNTNTPH